MSDSDRSNFHVTCEWCTTLRHVAVHGLQSMQGGGWVIVSTPCGNVPQADLGSWQISKGSQPLQIILTPPDPRSWAVFRTDVPLLILRNETFSSNNCNNGSGSVESHHYSSHSLFCNQLVSQSLGLKCCTILAILNLSGQNNRSVQTAETVSPRPHYTSDDTQIKCIQHL